MNNRQKIFKEYMLSQTVRKYFIWGEKPQHAKLMSIQIYYYKSKGVINFG